MNKSDRTAQQKYLYLHSTDPNAPKRYLSNSQKSVFNLKWDDPVIEKRNEIPKEPMYTYNPNVAYHPPTVPVTYYPYAHPPRMPKTEPNESKKTVRQPIIERTMKTSTRKQTEKPVSSVQGSNRLKIEHHYVDSPDEAQRIIEELRRRGFVETGIEIPGDSSRLK